MAEDCVNQAADLAGLPDRRCPTKHLNIHGFHRHADTFGSLSVYGSDAPAIRELARSEPALAEPLTAALPYTGAEAVFAARAEMARTVEDVLARRTRALFLDARAARDAAPRVADLLARELHRDPQWVLSQVRDFTALAAGYLVS
jgi:glycerol-3-phosphate dehydrogenase